MACQALRRAKRRRRRKKRRCEADEKEEEEEPGAELTKKEKEMQDRIEVLFETISTVRSGKSSTTFGIYAHVRTLPSFCADFI